MVSLPLEPVSRSLPLVPLMSAMFLPFAGIGKLESKASGPAVCEAMEFIKECQRNFRAMTRLKCHTRVKKQCLTPLRVLHPESGVLLASRKRNLEPV